MTSIRSQNYAAALRILDYLEEWSASQANNHSQQPHVQGQWKMDDQVQYSIYTMYMYMHVHEKSVYILLPISKLRGNHSIACSGKPNPNKKGVHVHVHVGSFYNYINCPG